MPFAPPLGRDLTYRIDQYRAMGGRDSRFSATRTLRFERSGDGYVLHSVLRLIESDAAADADAAYRAALTPLRDVPMRFRLDAWGRITGLEDMDRVWTAVRDGLAAIDASGDGARARTVASIRALFDGLSPDGRLALLAGEYQPLFLFAGDAIEDGAQGRGVRTMAGSPLGRPVAVEGTLRLSGRQDARITLEEVLAGEGVTLTMRYDLSLATGLVEGQTRLLKVGDRTLRETRSVTPAP